MMDDAKNKVTLKVEGMSCGHCVGRVQKALAEAPGVFEVSVDLDSGTAIISYGVGTDSDKLAEIVMQTGYTARAA